MLLLSYACVCTIHSATYICVCTVLMYVRTVRMYKLYSKVCAYMSTYVCVVWAPCCITVYSCVWCADKGVILLWEAVCHFQHSLTCNVTKIIPFALLVGVLMVDVLLHTIQGNLY